MPYDISFGVIGHLYKKRDCVCLNLFKVNVFTFVLFKYFVTASLTRVRVATFVVSVA